MLTAIIFGVSAEMAYSQSVVEGIVRSANGAVPFASVGVRNTTFGGAADIDGAYRISALPAGEYMLVASAVGYSTVTQAVSLTDGDTTRVEFMLEEAVIESDGVTVTGTLIESFVKESPVKVSVVSPSYMEKIPTANVMEVIENVNGLYQQVDCAVCGTNNIRINGMDGPYTAVLIDGMPIMSSLATVYGLNGISPALIQQVEIIKGPMSTLYGSEAMGGVINIITKNPVTSPSLTLNTFGTTDGEYALDVGAVPTRGRLATTVSGTLWHNDRFIDGNGDNFADLVLNTRASVFGKASLTSERGVRQADLSARYYYEDRAGGTSEYIENFTDELRGSDEVYGESIRTKRFETVGTYHIDGQRGIRLDAAFNHHDQDSYYGADSYDAVQTTAFGQLVVPIRVDGRNLVSFGGALRATRYDDNTPATGDFDPDGNEITNRPDVRVIPGVFAQHEWIASGAVRLLSGLRVDYQEDHGVIPSPRISLKVSPSQRTTVRLNAGTGFRIVNLFTEDHAAYSGSRATILLEDLDPERSVNATGAIQQVVDFGANPLTIDVEGFYTYFTNKIEPDYSQPGFIVYENLEGSATTRGVSVTMTQSLTSIPLSYTLGATVMDVFVTEDGEKRPLEFAPDFQGVANATYYLPRGFSIDYTMNLTGPMKMPEYEPPFEREPYSPTFSVHNLQVTKDFDFRSSKLQVYTALENIFDYRQPVPLVDPGDPFGPNFDTAYVYGPIHGRCLGVGVRWIAR